MTAEKRKPNGKLQIQKKIDPTKNKITQKPNNSIRENG